MRDCASPSTGQSGFTLIELLVVLAILGLVASLVTLTLRSATESFARASQFNSEGEEVEAIDSLLRGAISQAYPAKVGGDTENAVRFSGESQRVSFLSQLPPRFGAEDIALCSFQFTDDGMMHAIWQLDRPTNETVSIADDAIAGFSQANLSYFGPDQDDGVNRWFSSWKNKRSLPMLVRVKFIWQGRNHEVTIAPRITSAFCVSGLPELGCQ